MDSRCNWLDSVIGRVQGDAFKVLYYLVHAGGSEVRVSVPELARKIAVHPNTTRRALKALVADGLLVIASAAVPAQMKPCAYTVVGLPAAEAAPKPAKARAELGKADPQYQNVWDAFLAVNAIKRTVREPLTDSIVRRALEIGEQWGMTGYQVSSMLHKRYIFLQIKPVFPNKWVYFLNGLRKGFEDEARTQREDERVAREHELEMAARVIDIQAPPLPFHDDGGRAFSAKLANDIGIAAKKRSLG